MGKRPSRTKPLSDHWVVGRSGAKSAPRYRPSGRTTWTKSVRSCAAGPLPALGNVYLAAGHGMLGVSLSPATGRLMAELMCGQTPHVDPAPYATNALPLIA